MTAVDVLIEEMENNFDHFVLNKYYLIHLPSNYSIWICNGFWFFKFENGPDTFSLLDKWKFMWAFKSFNNKYVTLKLTKETL